MKKTVTIAIPAFNEEKNIKRLIDSILSQSTNNFELEQIVVYSDGSTDNTVDLINNNFENVKVFDFKDNLGKNKRVNQILKDNKSDILIQVDADIHLKDNNTFDQLVLPIINDSVNLCCAYHIANKPDTFVGKLAYFGFQIWDKARESLGEQGIRYYCEGGLRAFSSDLTQSLRIPEDRHMGEDSYSFYFAVKNEFKVSVCKQAKVYIDLADNYADYIRQMKRFLLEPGLMRQSFEEGLIDNYEVITSKIKLKILIGEFIKSPFIGIGYIALQSITKAQMFFYHQPIVWKPIQRK